MSPAPNMAHSGNTTMSTWSRTSLSRDMASPVSSVLCRVPCSLSPASPTLQWLGRIPHSTDSMVALHAQWGAWGHGGAGWCAAPCHLLPTAREQGAHQGLVRGCGTPHTALGVTGLLALVWGCGTLSKLLGAVGLLHAIAGLVGPFTPTQGWGDCLILF